MNAHKNEQKHNYSVVIKLKNIFVRATNPKKGMPNTHISKNTADLIYSLLLSYYTFSSLSAPNRVDPIKIIQKIVKQINQAIPFFIIGCFA